MDRSDDSAGAVLAGVAEMRRLAAEVVATVYPWAAVAGVVITTPPVDPDGGPQVTEWAVPCGRHLPPVGRRACELMPELRAAILRVYPDAVKASLCLSLPGTKQTAWLPVTTAAGGLSPCPSPSPRVSA
jgi:hypothetical protein